MFTSLRAAAAAHTQSTRRRPTRRSRLRGTCERDLWRPTSRREVWQIVLAARRHEVTTREPGRRSGALGHVALEVLELLGNIVCFRTGRLEPSLRYLMAKLRRSRDAIVRALAALEEHGFMESVRRVERTGIAPGEPGPQVRQVATARAIRLPKIAARLVGHYYSGRSPLPDDILVHREATAEARQTMLDSLDSAELPQAVVDDDPLGQALAQLGRHVQERESARRSETKSRESS